MVLFLLNQANMEIGWFHRIQCHFTHWSSLQTFAWWWSGTKKIPQAGRAGSLILPSAKGHKGDCLPKRYMWTGWKSHARARLLRTQFCLFSFSWISAFSSCLFYSLLIAANTTQNKLAWLVWRMLLLVIVVRSSYHNPWITCYPADGVLGPILWLSLNTEWTNPAS